MAGVWVSGVLTVYDSPASRFACRVPLLLTQKWEGWPFPLSPITLTPGSSPGQALALSHRGRGDIPPPGPGHPLRSLRSASPYASRRGRVIV